MVKGTVAVYGNVYSGYASIGITNDTLGDIVVYGNIIGYSNNGVSNYNLGTVTLYGSAFGGSSLGAAGILNSSFGQVYLYGSTIGGSGAYAAGLSNQTGMVYITGSAVAGSGSNAAGIYNYGAGSIILKGDAIGGIQSAGVLNVFRNGTVKATKAISNNSAGMKSTNNAINIVTYLETGSSAVFPVEGPTFVDLIPDSTITFKNNNYNIVMFSELSSSNNNYIVPKEENVRYGVKYYFDKRTGTVKLPLPGQVKIDEPIDDTIGTSFSNSSDFWNYPFSAINIPTSIGVRAISSLPLDKAGEIMTFLKQ